jgi:hypothetical protein
MTDERLEYLLSVERRLTRDEFDEFVAEWRRQLPELRRQTREALDAMERLSRGRRPVHLQ